MAIIQGACSSFKQELFQAVHDFDNDTFRMALFVEDADLSQNTTVYDATNEATGTGYTAGGQALTGVSVNLDGRVAFVDFDDVTWTTTTLTARGALIYNASKANRAVAVIDFGENKSTSGGNFVYSPPAGLAPSAIIRIP